MTRDIAAELRARESRFHEAVAAEVARARAKFPGNRHQYVALAEEVGEVAKALIESESPEAIYAECVQVAAMAQRVAEDGDDDFPDYEPADEAASLVESSQGARVHELEQALAPFARVLADVLPSPEERSDLENHGFDPDEGIPHDLGHDAPTVGDYRRAARVLGPASTEPAPAEEARAIEAHICLDCGTIYDHPTVCGLNGADSPTVPVRDAIQSREPAPAVREEARLNTEDPDEPGLRAKDQVFRETPGVFKAPVRPLCNEREE